MSAKRSFLGSRLCGLCIVSMPLVFAAPLEASGIFTVLPANSYATSINDSGVVAGFVGDGSELGFVRTPDGTTTTFSAGESAHQTEPQCINNEGVITGYYFGSVAHSFVRAADGTITLFDAPGADGAGTAAQSINAHGVIAGGVL